MTTQQPLSTKSAISYLVAFCLSVFLTLFSVGILFIQMIASDSVSSTMDDYIFRGIMIAVSYALFVLLPAAVMAWLYKVIANAKNARIFGLILASLPTLLYMVVFGIFIYLANFQLQGGNYYSNFPKDSLDNNVVEPYTPTDGLR